MKICKSKIMIMLYVCCGCRVVEASVSLYLNMCYAVLKAKVCNTYTVASESIVYMCFYRINLHPLPYNDKWENFRIF